MRAPLPAQLAGRETWLTSALHGIRPVGEWLVAARRPPVAPTRAPAWQRGARSPWLTSSVRRDRRRSTTASFPTRCWRRAAAPTPSRPVDLEPGARVLDCACGHRHARRRPRAARLRRRRHRRQRGDDPAHARAGRRAWRRRSTPQSCAWEDLPQRGWQDSFDVVLCVGNSLPHAVGRTAAARRCTAMAAPAPRAAGSSSPRARGSRCAPPARGCRSPSSSSSATAAAGCRSTPGRSPSAGTSRTTSTSPSRSSPATAAVTTHRERFAFWPFTEDELREDLREAGLEPEDAACRRQGRRATS